MAKSFRRFREDSYDDEWGNDDDYENKRKRNKLRERKQKQRQKFNEKMSSFDEKDLDD